MVLRGVDSPGAGLGRARGALPGIRGHRRGARAAHHRRRARRQPYRKEGGLDVGLEYGCDSKRLHQLSGHYPASSQLINKTLSRDIRLGLSNSMGNPLNSDHSLLSIAV